MSLRSSIRRCTLKLEETLVQRVNMELIEETEWVIKEPTRLHSKINLWCLISSKELKFLNSKHKRPMFTVRPNWFTSVMWENTWRWTSRSNWFSSMSTPKMNRKSSVVKQLKVKPTVMQEGRVLLVLSQLLMEPLWPNSSVTKDRWSSSHQWSTRYTWRRKSILSLSKDMKWIFRGRIHFISDRKTWTKDNIK